MDARYDARFSEMHGEIAVPRVLPPGLANAGRQRHRHQLLHGPPGNQASKFSA